MPTYIFRCASCGHEFSVETSWTKKKDVRCPKCNTATLKELFDQYRPNIVGGGDAFCSDACG